MSPPFRARNRAVMSIEICPPIENHKAVSGTCSSSMANVTSVEGACGVDEAGLYSHPPAYFERYWKDARLSAHLLHRNGAIAGAMAAA